MENNPIYFNNIKLKTYFDDNIYTNILLNKNKSHINNYILPDNWIKLFDKKTGNYYYVCKITKHTQWLHPSIPIGTLMDNGLPYGWNYKYDFISKKKYYINHISKFNTWISPI
jgi:hypothetical protein